VADLAPFSPRAACSDAERRLAVWAHDDLRARGHEAWVETHWVRPQRAAGLALGCGLTVAGGLIAIGAPVVGLIVAALGAVSVTVDAAGRTGPLRCLLPRRATQVVLVVPGDEGGHREAPMTTGDEGRHREAPMTTADEGGHREARAGTARVELLLVARTDVPRGGLAWRLARVPGGLWWLAACTLAVVAAAAARVAGADGTLLGALQLAPTVVLLGAVAGALDELASSVGDGRAEDAAVVAVLAAHDRLVRDPAPGIAAGLLLAGPDALRAHLRRERLDPRRTALLHVAAGPVRSRHRQWRAAAEAAGLEARGGGPRGLPAALAPPDDAERLARALAQTL
jgi:hypothetical protein